MRAAFPGDASIQGKRIQGKIMIEEQVKAPRSGGRGARRALRTAADFGMLPALNRGLPLCRTDGSGACREDRRCLDVHSRRGRRGVSRSDRARRLDARRGKGGRRSGLSRPGVGAPADLDDPVRLDLSRPQSRAQPAVWRQAVDLRADDRCAVHPRPRGQAPLADDCRSQHVPQARAHVAGAAFLRPPHRRTDGHRRQPPASRQSPIRR